MGSETDRRVSSFQVDAALLSELGENLVTKPDIAVAELVKNSYDAEASECVIRFIPSKDHSRVESIVISDNGHGMSPDDVEQRWLKIATTSKRSQKRSSRFGRVFAGSKGLGRLACRTLSERLLLETVHLEPDKAVRTTVSINWADFKSGSLIDETKVELTIDDADRSAPGTAVTLMGLKQNWTRRPFEMLQKHVSALIIPDRFEGLKDRKDPGFDIVFDNSLHESDGLVQLHDKLRDAGWGRLIGSFNGSNANIKLFTSAKAPALLTLELVPSGLTGVVFDIAWITGKREDHREPQFLTNALSRKLIDSNTGVHVYLDEFRVPPYGEERDDWLRIHETRARRHTSIGAWLLQSTGFARTAVEKAFLNYPSPSHLFGEVAIDSTRASGFEPTTSREGFVDSEQLNLVSSTIQKALDWMVVHRAAERSAAQLNQVDERRSSIRRQLSKLGSQSAPDPESLLKAAASALEVRLDDDETVRSAVVKSLQVVQSEWKLNNQTSEIMAAAASNGALSMAFMHELQDLGEMLRDLISGDTVADTNFAALLGVARDIESIILSQIRLLQELSRFRAARGAGACTLSEALALAEPAIEAYARRLGLGTFKREFGEDTAGKRLGISSPALFAVLSNALTNALKSCRAAGGKSVVLVATGLKKVAAISILDEGVGVDLASAESLFRPLVVDPENRIYSKLRSEISGGDYFSGIGLGLFITRQLLYGVGGSAEFVAPRDNFKTELRIEIPWAAS